MSSSERQRIQKVPGARRAKLTPAAGTGAEPVPADDAADADASDGNAGRNMAGAERNVSVPERNVAAVERNVAAPPVGGDAASARSTAPGPNDERMRQDVPPHY